MRTLKSGTPSEVFERVTKTNCAAFRETIKRRPPRATLQLLLVQVLFPLKLCGGHDRVCSANTSPTDSDVLDYSNTRHNLHRRHVIQRRQKEGGKEVE